MIDEANTWTPGQRWVSDGEPELGLGVILRAGDGRVEISFPAAAEKRIYAIGTAPLRRVKFHTGDKVLLRSGNEITVDSVELEKGLWIYSHTEGKSPETELAATISFSKPEDRLFGGKLDEPGEFDLRGEALQMRENIRRSTVSGLTGARMDLIPHQLFIADEVSNRLRPRVLLADEVGLGKTIEACLIIHRLLLTERASRILILVPEPLVHQWFVELLRRFQLSFSIFDDERCEAIDRGTEEINPFLDSQWVLAATNFLAEDPTRAQQAKEAGWDLLVVDEAHHLEWAPGAPGESYEMVRSLAESIEGLLLLTATPRQLGPEGHFARLKLLDPERYPNLESYLEETLHYEQVADVVEDLSQGKAPDERLDRITEKRERLHELHQQLRQGVAGARETLISTLLDSFGIGRVMFRNTRAKLGGFPGREPHFYPAEEKSQWLSNLLGLHEDEKFLVITKTKESAEALLNELESATGVKGALFHEELTLLQRDRNAAYFAEPEGARVLVCSEIGSEGRNFQFARHLVLLDLPDDVDLLEQRIGRLDRIGQRGTIHIHVPYDASGPDSVHVRWLDEGLDAFRSSPIGAAEIQHSLANDLAQAMEQPELADALIQKTASRRKEISERLAKGQERLLERSSHRPDEASKLLEDIRQWDDDAYFEDFLMRLFEYSGLQIEELGSSRYFLIPAALKSDAFPTLPAEGMTVTLDRQHALSREQEAFLTMDHPIVRGALDLMLGSEAGNAAFGVWESAGEKTILLETLMVVECIAPARLHVDRFLPQTALRFIVDHKGTNHTDDPAFSQPPLRKGDPSGLIRNPKVKQTFLPEMLAASRVLAEARITTVVDEAMKQMTSEMDAEINRLQDLAEINDHVRPEEIEALQSLRSSLAEAISSARIRLDAVRLIWKAPSA